MITTCVKQTLAKQQQSTESENTSVFHELNVLSTCEDVKVPRASLASAFASSNLALKLSN